MSEFELHKDFSTSLAAAWRTGPRRRVADIGEWEKSPAARIVESSVYSTDLRDFRGRNGEWSDRRNCAKSTSCIAWINSVRNTKANLRKERTKIDLRKEQISKSSRRCVSKLRVAAGLVSHTPIAISIGKPTDRPTSSSSEERPRNHH